MVQPKQILILGAGPIGLEAALYGVQAGFDVQVFEKARAAEHVRQWGHVRLFSPFGMNSTEQGRAAVAETGADLPAQDAILTGREFVERYLSPLSRTPELARRIHEGVEVQAVGRTRTWKGQHVGRPERDRDRFRLLLSDGSKQWTAEADCVLDCTGTYANPRRIGAGGLPAVGELEALTPEDYRLRDVSGADCKEYAGRTTLVVGGGYSAATSVVALAQLAGEVADTRAVWVTHDRPTPIARIENDRLPERDELARRANAIALSKGGPIHWLPGAMIHRIKCDNESGRLHVSIDQPPKQTADARAVGNQGTEHPAPSTQHPNLLVVDRVLAHAGARPDATLYQELQVHQCYATEGPMKLAAALMGETSADCLNQTPPGADTLRNPEPGFFILGAKSYGRNSRFLLQIGHAQISDVYALISDT